MAKYIAATQKLNMLLCTKGEPSSVAFDMVDFGISDELTHSYQDADMGVENE
jgi:hypothetical protein